MKYVGEKFLGNLISPGLLFPLKLCSKVCGISLCMMGKCFFLQTYIQNIDAQSINKNPFILNPLKEAYDFQ